MPKLRLDAEHLEVQSFEVIRTGVDERRGTVRGHAETAGTPECYISADGQGPCGPEHTGYDPPWCFSYDPVACPDTGPES